MVVDEPALRLELPDAECRCRLQVVTDDVRYLAVTVQRPDGSDGGSVTNNAEGVLKQVRSLLGLAEAVSVTLAPHYVGHGRVAAFDGNTGAFRRLTDGERVAIDRLVELDRGIAAPAPPSPGLPTDAWVVRDVSGLPRPDPFRASRCMGPGLGPQPDGGCCWYHGADWAPAAGILEEWIRGGMPEAALWGSDVAGSLWVDPIAIGSDGAGAEWFYNGQHRVQAMLDQAVRRVVVVMPRRGPFPGDSIIIGAFTPGEVPC